MKAELIKGHPELKFTWKLKQLGPSDYKNGVYDVKPLTFQWVKNASRQAGDMFLYGHLACQVSFEKEKIFTPVGKELCEILGVSKGTPVKGVLDVKKHITFVLAIPYWPKGLTHTGGHIVEIDPIFIDTMAPEQSEVAFKVPGKPAIGLSHLVHETKELGPDNWVVDRRLLGIPPSGFFAPTFIAQFDEEDYLDANSVYLTQYRL